jgi:hypothetical protein
LARRDEALQMFERAFAADPLSPLATDEIAWWGYALRGDRQRLLDLNDEMDRMSPNDPKVSWIRSNLALIEGRALDWDRFVARVIEVDPADYQNHAWLTTTQESPCSTLPVTTRECARSCIRKAAPARTASRASRCFPATSQPHEKRCSMP